MSNYLAIATITATLQRILQASIQGDVDGARVTTLQPRQVGNGTPETGINLFLYQVKRNNAFGNIDTATHRVKANIVKRQSALDLHYIVSCYGNETELEPQRLLGSVVRIFNDRPTVSLDVVQATIADPSFRFLAEADLAEQIQQLNVCPLDLSLDDLSKVWSVFFQAPYLLSAIYKVTVVTIEGEEALPKALPVRDRKLGGVVAFPHQPVVESVQPQTGKLDPILATSTLIIRGRNLESASTLIRIGEAQLAPLQCSSTEITASLADIPPGMLWAGAQGIQVSHQIPLGTTLTEGTNNVESNLAPFVLRPTIEQVRFESRSRSGDDYCTGILTVRVDVRVSIKQRVILILNEWSIETALAYQFAAPPREMETDTIEIPLEKVKSGDYLLRLQIDGAESILEIDTDPASATFDWFAAPKVRLV
ncbi:MAG: DUF4255 domain-containing protein [Stenomitos rutilans HA7619-LM2]|nr:DUF4255 domain-containing protein [Stenomitos rutilans HA7619-LM2]